MISSDRRMQLFYRLPYKARCALASGEGIRLRGWRYGLGFDDLVSEALERDHWTTQRWAQHHENELERLLDHAARRVPYYRTQWRARRRRGDNSSWSELANWPILDKGEVRRFPHAFIADDATRFRHTTHTSGTTGTPLRLVHSRHALRQWYALHEARTRIWHGVSRRDHWAILGAKLIAEPGSSEPPFWVASKSLGQLYMSMNHLSARTVDSYATALASWAPSHVVGNPSTLADLSRRALDAGVSLAGPRVLLANAEQLSDQQRSIVKQAFGAPLRETYGQSEGVMGASECSAGRIHYWPDAGVLEVLGSDHEPVAAGDSGNLVLTGLLNPVQPLVRYDIGDSARLGQGEPCPCGRSLPFLHSIEGRIDDLFTTIDGRRVGGLNSALHAELPIVEAQLVQTAVDHVRVVVVAAEGFGDEAEAAIVKSLGERLGPINVTFAFVDHIPREPNGKFKMARSEITEDGIR